MHITQQLFVNTHKNKVGTTILLSKHTNSSVPSSPKVQSQKSESKSQSDSMDEGSNGDTVKDSINSIGILISLYFEAMF